MKQLTQQIQFVLQSKYAKKWNDIGENFVYLTLQQALVGQKHLAKYNKNHHGKYASPLRIIERLTIVFDEVIE